MVQISLIDYGCGNIRSVAQAFEYLGHGINIHSKASHIQSADYLVLPGVGAFEKASRALTETNLGDAIIAHIKKGNPFLGICVGMQVLMDKGFEFMEHKGLGLINGTVQSLQHIHKDIQIPHIGWSQIVLDKNSYFQDFDLDGEYFYFNHSFVCIPDDQGVISGRCGGNEKPWPAIIEKDNVIGIQCHPEKSHIAGLQFLKAFTQMK